MDISLAEYERIQKYIDGEMTSGEKETFVAELKTNEALRAHFELEMRLQDVLWNKQIDGGFTDLGLELSVDTEIGDEDEKRILALLKGEQNKKETKGIDMPPKRSNAFWYRLAAACVLLIIAGTIWYFLKEPKTPGIPPVVKTDDTTETKKNQVVVIDTSGTNKQIIPGQERKVKSALAAKKYYTKDKAPEDPTVPPLLKKPLQGFNEGSNDITKIDLKNISVSRGSNDEQAEKIKIKELGHYYKGLAFIEMNENDKAVENLVWVVDSTANDTLRTKAKWYLALTYLKQNDYNQAEPLLKWLADKKNNTAYRKQAEEILNLLK